MDIKLKNYNDLRGRGYHGIALVLSLAVVVVALFPLIIRNASKNQISLYKQEYFVDKLYYNGFVLYWELAQKRAEQPLSPHKVFLPELEYYLEYAVDEGDYEAALELQELQEVCLNQLEDWRHTFHRDWNSLAYLAVDDYGYMTGNGGDDLLSLMFQDDWLVEEDLYHYGAELEDYLTAAYSTTAQPSSSKYDYYVVLRYSRNGSISVQTVSGAPKESLSQLELYDNWEHWDNLFYSRGAYTDMMQVPRSMTVVYAVPKGSDSRLIWSQGFYQRQSFAQAGFNQLFYASLLLAVLTGLLIGRREYAIYRFANRFYLEGLGLIAFFALSAWQWLVQWGVSIQQEHLVLSDPNFVFEGLQAVVLGYLFSYMTMASALLLVFLGAVSLWQIRRRGGGWYLLNRSLLVRFLRWCAGLARTFYRWITDVDLSNEENKAIYRVLAVNFIILGVICCFWFFGIALLLIYTLVVAQLLRRRTARVRADYMELLRATGEMAQGTLDVEIREDVGPFRSLGQELQKVQQGFRHAVEAEVKSQNMRTELVTNVSHDLKTPLTAIITYINLLKEEGVTREEQTAYIETLDSKAQRLKVLIEDLFEVSKASSGNLTLELSTVDLPSLIRQVQLEVKDEVEASGIDFRHRFGQERVELELDGEKTSRVFENLILNITKYAMPGTRAYIDLSVEPEQVMVELKNMSRDPLDFDTGDLTERFVRGDRSRNTEGSGLGLAICKSFVDLQGGTFRVATDGDLFKAVLTFPLKVQGTVKDAVDWRTEEGDLAE